MLDRVNVLLELLIQNLELLRLLLPPERLEDFGQIVLALDHLVAVLLELCSCILGPHLSLTVVLQEAEPFVLHFELDELDAEGRSRDLGGVYLLKVLLQEFRVRVRQGASHQEEDVVDDSEGRRQSLDLLQEALPAGESRSRRLIVFLRLPFFFFLLVKRGPLEASAR